MTSRAAWRTELASLEPAEWPDFLGRHSGLPGPRGNLELAMAFADIATRPVIDRFAGSTDEYLAVCGTVALGARATTPEVVELLRRCADDDRWRVREAVAIGLQLLGDVDLDRVLAVVEAWADDPSPLVRRAAAATICEPRLLTTPRAAATALEVCRRATIGLTRLDPAGRRDPAVRTLRQALGYCWSVAIAADPSAGLRAFRALDTADADVAWIVRENLRKHRLAALLPSEPPVSGDLRPARPGGHGEMLEGERRTP